MKDKMCMRVFDENSGIKQSSGLMQASKICLVVLVWAALAANAQEQQPKFKVPVPQGTRQPRVLTLEECIQMALQHNLDIQIQRYNPLINEYALNINSAYYEPTLSFRASHNFNSSPGGINPQTGLPFTSSERNTDSYTPELFGTVPSGDLPIGGLTYDLIGPLSEQSGSSIPPGSSFKYTSSPGITLRQPLLKNLWIDNNRFQILLSKNTLKTSKEALRQSIMATITSVQQAYYNLIFAREAVKVNQAAFQLAEQLLNENRKRVEVGALAPLDEKQSQSQAATSWADLLSAQHVQVTQENLLKGLLTDNYGEWANVTPVPSEGLSAVQQEVDLQQSWRIALEKRPDMAQQRLFLDRQNITVKYNYNQLFPQVDLTGSYGRNAANNTFSGNLDDIRQERNPFYSYGVIVSIPLGNGAARNSYKSAKVSAKQALLQLKQLEQSVIVQIDNDVGQVELTYRRIGATREARIFAEEALYAEQKKLENGKSTSFVVLQLQRDLTLTRSNEIRALADYNIALAQLALDEGITLEQNRIEFKVK
ncbi:MAG: Outer rane efflux protein [Pedosphaera sp.]|nr:Outer rane efflux protein [Pedosphaera sp.]